MSKISKEQITINRIKAGVKISRQESLRLANSNCDSYPSLCMGCGEHIYYCTCKKDKK